MVKTIFERMSVVTDLLDQVTPKRWEVIQQLHVTRKMYAVTITYKANYTITVTKIRQPTFKYEGKGTKTLYDQNIVIKKKDRFEQIRLTGNQLEKDLQGLEYILYPEFTKNGMIHWHGLMFHPDMPACGIVQDSILKVLRRYGKQQDVQEVVHLDVWYKYIIKEGRFPIMTEMFKWPTV